MHKLCCKVLWIIIIVNYRGFENVSTSSHVPNMSQGQIQNLPRGGLNLVVYISLKEEAGDTTHRSYIELSIL